MAFKGNIPAELIVNHIDRDKTNNRIDNLPCAKTSFAWRTLEIITKVENTIHAIKLGTKHTKPVRQLSLAGEIITTFLSITEASKATGVDNSGIGRVAKGNQNTAGNFLWQFV